MTANYQDVTPEVLRRVAEFLADEPRSKWVFAATLNRIAAELDADAVQSAQEPRVFKTIAEIPDDLEFLVNEQLGTLIKRRGSGWWYVDTPDSPVQAGNGWRLVPDEFPLTEYVQEIN